MAIDQGYAAWLKSTALYTSAVNNEVAARWLASAVGVQSEVISPLAFKADAVAEAQKQADLMGGPNAIDVIIVPGRQRGVRGRAVQIKSNRLGYDGDGQTVFVIGAVENDNGTTTLTVIRRLARGGTAVINAYISPTGTGGGTSWDDAAPLSALNSQIAKARAGFGDVLLRADQGPYNFNGPVTLSQGGTLQAPVSIRGVDGNGNPMLAEIIGSRIVDTTGTRMWNAKNDTAAGVYGKEVFRLNSGCNNLAFRFLHFRNQGRGCIRVRQALSNLVVTDCRATNVAAFLTNDAASGAGVPTVSGLTVQRTNVRGFSKFAIKLETGDSNNILIEDFIFDSERQDGDNFASGIVFDGTAHDILIRRGEIRNIIDSVNTYQNGDGIAGERRNNNITVEDVTIEVCTDGGVDFKGDNIVMRRCTIRFCHRNYRLWGYAMLIDCIGENPGDNAGFNKYAKANVSVFDFGMTRVIGGRYTQTNTTSAVFRVEKGGMCSVSPSTVIQTQGAIYSVEAVTGTNPPGQFIWMDPNDVTPPVITSSLGLTLDENKFGIFALATDKPAQLRIVGGPAAKYFTTYGTQLRLPRRDFENPAPEALDNLYGVDIQFMDGNGNLSVPRRATVQINDVADDPITPAILRDQFGVTKGAYSVVTPDVCWQDVGRTIPGAVDALVAVVDDAFGFGTAAVQSDVEQQAYLRQIGGVYFLDLTGRERYAIGAPGYFNMPEVTAAFMIRRDAEEQTFRLLFTNPRNADPATSTNYRWGIGMDGGQNYYVYVNGSTYSGGSSSGLNAGSDRVVSMQSVPTTGRVNGVQTIDGADHPAMTFGAVAQAYIGGSYDGTKNMAGRLYGWVITNNTLDAGTTLFRVERQLADAAGIVL